MGSSINYGIRNVQKEVLMFWSVFMGCSINYGIRNVQKEVLTFST